MFLSVSGKAAHSLQKVLHIGVSEKPLNIDPIFAEKKVEVWIAQALWSPLVSRDPDTLKPIPRVARHWKVEDGGRRYTFSLRDDVMWSNGQRVTAMDFVHSWSRILTHRDCPFRDKMTIFKNGAEYIRGEVKNLSEVGFQSLSPQVLEITVSDPERDLLSELANPMFAALSTEGIETFEKGEKIPLAIISDGPFKWGPQGEEGKLCLKKNPSYWNAAHIFLDELNFYVIESVVKQERLFREEKIDVTDSLPRDKILLWLSSPLAKWLQFEVRWDRVESDTIREGIDASSLPILPPLSLMPFSYVHAYLKSDRVRGWVMSPDNVLSYEGVSIQF